MGKKLKIAYALRSVVLVDEQGNKTIRYERFHPISSGNAIIVGGKTLTNKFKEYYTKTEIDAFTGASGSSIEEIQGQIEALQSADESLATSISTKQDTISELSSILAHLNNKDNPHTVTKTQVGLGNCDNTADADKPVSTAQQTALDAKADKSDTYDKSSVYTKTEVDDKFDAIPVPENATQTSDGFMSKEDKVILDNVWTMLDTDENNEAIDNWNEVKTFLASINPTEKTLVGLLNGKQNVIDEENKLDASLVANIPSTLPANGGNADTVDNYHFVVGSSAGTDANTIYFVV